MEEEEEEEEAALWRILNGRRKGRGAAAFKHEVEEEEDGSDFIEYHLYLDSMARSSDPAAELEAAARQVLEVTAAHRAAYLWQQDTFCLAVVVPPLEDGEEEEEEEEEEDDDEPPHLHGLVRVADAVEDQWFVVWLLRLATAHPELAAKGLTARVADSDGDPLLIEGSAACPHAWLEGPEEGTHRAWIRNGEARFIADDLHPPTLEQLRVQLPRTSAQWLDASVASRVQGYPERIAAETHHATCYLPPAAAAVLTACPRLTAAAVRALGSSGPGDLASLSKSKSNGDRGGDWRFPPSELVPVRLPFARRAFGRLQHAGARAPEAFLSAIADVMTREGRPSSLQARTEAALERGVRLACGLELLYRRSRRGGSEGAAAAAAAAAVGSPARGTWQGYVARMQTRGFFDGVVEGSADHRARVVRARETFERRERQEAARRAGRAVPEPGGETQPSPDLGRPLHECVDRLLARRDPLQAVSSASMAALPPDDDEGWLEMEPSQLDLLLERYGQSMQHAGAGQGMEYEEDSDDGASGDDEGDEDEDVEVLLEGVKGFLMAEGGLGGAETPRGPSSKGKKSVSCDVERLLNILRGHDGQEALQQGGLGDSVVDGEDSEQEGEGKERMAVHDLPARASIDTGADGWRQGFGVREIPRGGDSDVDSDDGLPCGTAGGTAGGGEDDKKGRRGEGEDGEGVMDMYMAQLDEELKGTTLDASFERAPVAGRTGSAAATAAAAAAAAAAEDDGKAELPPVDLDLNLVRHLLDSVASQGGAPGPASNLLGEIFERRRRPPNTQLND